MYVHPVSTSLIVTLTVRTLAIVCILVLLACGTSLKRNAALATRLKNRGPVALSSSNPYLAANLLLSKEIEHSPELKGFVGHRGAPGAIEISSSRWSSDLVMWMYYPENREYYTADYSMGTWVIKGPQLLPRERLVRVLAQVGTTPQTVALLSSESPAVSVAPMTNSGRSNTASKINKPPPALHPKLPSEKKNYTPEKVAQTQVSDLDPSASSQISPMLKLNSKTKRQTIEEVVAAHSGPGGERTPGGDLVHYVTYPGETLSMISRWYTYERANVSRLARINDLTTPDKLEVGDTVVIPTYLLRNRKLLTEDALRHLQVIARDERNEARR